MNKQPVAAVLGVLAFSFITLCIACGGADSSATPPTTEAGWTWMSGSNAGNQGGIYGIKGKADPQNIPGARESAVSWVDSKGNFWLFGGYAYGAPEHYWGQQNDLWKYDPTTNEWTWISGDDGPGAPGVYGTKGIASPSNVPGARQSAASWSDASGKLWLFGGWGCDADGHWSDLNDLWRFDPATVEWTWIAGSKIFYQPGIYGTKGVAAPEGTPGARESAVTWVDSSGKLWLFGGAGLDSIGELGGALNDLWRFDPRTLEWKWVSGDDIADQEGSYGTKGVTLPSNVPGGTGGAVSWIDPEDNLWLLVGGGNALWKFDTTQLEWTWISGSDRPDEPGSYGTQGVASSSNVPGARQAAVSWLGSNGRLWLFGGYGRSAADSGLLNDLWMFDPATLKWTWVAGTSTVDQKGIYGTKGTLSFSNVPGGRTKAISWKAPNGGLWLFGGGGCSAEAQDQRLSDLWRYSGVGQTIPPSSAVRVTIAPDAPSVYVTESVQFNAMVHNSANDAVSWSLSGVGCGGGACGTLSNSGFYTAPASAPSPATVTVRATSVADPSKSASATVTIVDAAVKVTMTPDAASVYAGESRLLRASVQYSTNHEVTWSVSGAGCDGAACGTVGSDGLYTAPAIVPGSAPVTVTATSVADPTRTASASVTILEPVANQWAWISGSDDVSQAGMYGTRGVSGPTNVPGSRESATASADRLGRLWLFGGSSVWPHHQGSYNELWVYDTSTGEWTWVSGSTITNRPGSYGTQGMPDPSNIPGSREQAVSWIDASGNFWLFGGYGYALSNDTAGELNDLWRFDTVTGEWTWVSGNNGLDWHGSYGIKGVADPSSRPGARRGAVPWADSIGNLWLFGGYGYDATTSSYEGNLNDLWKYETATGLWTWVSGSDTRDQAGSYGTKGVPDPSSIPPARHGAVGWLDPQGTLWLFGGGELNDLWRFDPAALEWTWVSGSSIGGQAGIYGTMGVADVSNVPGGRWGAVPWCDAGGRLWLFGGYGRDSTGYDSELNDLWMYDPATSAWTWVSGRSSLFQSPYGVYGTRGIADLSDTPGCRHGAVSWTDSRGRFWLFGGNGYGGLIAGQLNDLWRFIR